MSIEIFHAMLDQVMTEVAIGNHLGEQALIFKSASGKVFKFFHSQTCCERVEIEDISGDLSDLVGSPILMAEEVDNIDVPEIDLCVAESHTWTFYKFATNKGTVVVRWLGISNGFYGEGVSYVEE